MLERSWSCPSMSWISDQPFLIHRGGLLLYKQPLLNYNLSQVCFPQNWPLWMHSGPIPHFSMTGRVMRLDWKNVQRKKPLFEKQAPNMEMSTIFENLAWYCYSQVQNFSTFAKLNALFRPSKARVGRLLMLKYLFIIKIAESGPVKIEKNCKQNKSYLKSRRQCCSLCPHFIHFFALFSPFFRFFASPRRFAVWTPWFCLQF